MTPGNLLCVWLLAINLAAAVLTVIDKSRAKRGKWRISENTLLLTGLLGGALAMYVTMRCIHHKTRKKKIYAWTAVRNSAARCGWGDSIFL